MKNQRSKKFVCFFDRDGRFLGALPEDARIGDVGACGLRGVHSIGCLDRGGIAREIESEELDDWAEEELARQDEAEMKKTIHKEGEPAAPVTEWIEIDFGEGSPTVGDFIRAGFEIGKKAKKGEELLVTRVKGDGKYVIDIGWRFADAVKEGKAK